MIDVSTVARRVARLHADLRAVPTDSSGLARALDDIGSALDRLLVACEDDDVALCLGAPRATAASYVVATTHLAEVGADPLLREDILRRGMDQVSHELADVERQLEEDVDGVSTLAGGTRTVDA